MYDSAMSHLINPTQHMGSETLDYVFHVWKVKLYKLILPQKLSGHWSRMTHVWVTKLTIIVLDNSDSLSEPVFEYCWLDPWEQTSVKFISKSVHFHSRKIVLKMSSCLGLNISNISKLMPKMVDDILRSITIHRMCTRVCIFCQICQYCAW